MTPDAVTHAPYDVTWTAGTFTTTVPALFGTMHTFDGGDPSHMRQGDAGVTTEGAQFFVEEEGCTDAEIAHTTETVGIFAVETGVAGSSTGKDPCEGLGSNHISSGNTRNQGEFQEICPNLDDWHTTIDQEGYSRADVCDVLVMTRGTNCRSYCMGQGRLCLRAQDNSGSGCLIDTGGHERQTTDDNGCLQNWNNQICGCSGDIVNDASLGLFQDRVCEHQRMTLDCTGIGDGTITVVDASYGRQDGPDVCPHAATGDQNCHEITSTDIVAAECQGAASCTIVASNGVFGDPCGGTFKYLTVNYSCNGGMQSGGGGGGGGNSSDLNGDGEVNVTDLLMLLAAYGQNAGGDTNGDGETNVADRACPSHPPEPFFCSSCSDMASRLQCSSSWPTSASKGNDAFAEGRPRPRCDCCVGWVCRCDCKGQTCANKSSHCNTHPPPKGTKSRTRS